MPTLTIGDWKLRTLETGWLWLDGGAMFGSVPKPLWSRSNPPDERNRIRLAMRCLLAEGHGRVVVVDVGLGDKSDAKFRDIFRVEDGDGVVGALAQAGRAPGDVTDVVLTHLHFDHAGGATRRDGDALRPTLPNAKYWVQRRNLENARQPNPRERASYLAENFEPLVDAGVLGLWDGVTEPWPGFEVIPVHGHTRGQQVIHVTGGGRAAWFLTDMVPTTAHVRVPYVMGYDVAALETMTEKREILARAVAERAWVVLEHDPDIAVARPEAVGDDFAWAERVDASSTPEV